MCSDFSRREVDVADYILECHNGDARAAIETMQEEIEHLQYQLNLAVVAMGYGFTRGWVHTRENKPK